MTSKTEFLLKEVGANVAESLGLRTAAPTAPTPTVADSKKYDGRTSRRDAGEMVLSNIIADPSQPRKEFNPDSIARLAQSLKDHGQLQAIRVRWSDDYGKWIILAGERRYRAAVQAGLASICCIFVEGELSEADILEEQLIENCLREDLKPIEQAHAFRTLMRTKSWSGKELAEHLHLHPSSVTHALALLELPTDIQEKVAVGQLAPTVAYEVTKIADPEAQREVVEEVIAGNLSRREARDAISRKRGNPAGETPIRSSTLTFKTPGKRWAVAVTANEMKVSELEVADELEALAAQIRARAKAPTEAA
ncbi:MAG TPA: ParB/RepB/Spo0J family partition protein [Gemmataceae bacterium]|nr:ParB/RepB/Spo0J family partition protein [Gemmataceae bacterium]